MTLILKDNRLSSLINLSQKAFGEYRGQVIVLIVLGFVGGFLEGVGVNALIPLFSFIMKSSTPGNDLVSKTIKSFFDVLNLNFSVINLLIFIGVLFILKGLITLWFEYIKIKITADYEEKTRNSLFNKILAANWPFLIRLKSGYLETILMIDVPASAQLLNQISSIIMISTSLLIYILIAINISFTITLITLVLGCVVFLFFKSFFSKIKMVADERTEINKMTAHYVNESIYGIKTIKTMVVVSGVISRAKNFFSRLRDLSVKSTILKTSLTVFIQPFAVIFICFIFAFVYRIPSFNLAILAAIVYLIERIFIYVQQLYRALHNLNDLYPHLKSNLDYSQKAHQNIEKDQGKEHFVFQDSLELKNVMFSYDGQRQVIDHLSFKVNKGEMVGVVGPSGVGKTTLVDLILRLFKPTGGEILLDGRNIESIEVSDWRKKIGYVSQDIFLMNDTIANNIRFYDEGITEADLVQAAKMANIYDFIQSCPDKFATMVGERGLMLSAGQRQRIVIARVLAKKPELLILDEATSALDNESELKIQEVIKNLKGQVTVLAIAHRLSTVMDSDELIVLDNGKIIEQGSPRQLLEKKDSYFYKVYNIRDLNRN